MTGDLRAKIAERCIARGRELLERYDAARQRASAAEGILAAVNRAIETSQQPGVHAKLVGTDHPQSVHAQHIAQNEIKSACDILVADKMARFAFPELRLGLIPGFGGIPRLKRDLGNAFVRDLLLTGRSVNAARAQAVGLVAQLAAEGEALKIARSTASQITKFDAVTRAAAKKFIKPIPHDELRREIDLFCELFTRPAVMAALKKFVKSTDAMPYLP